MRVTGRGKLIGAVARRDKRRARNFALFSSQAGYLSDLFKPSSSICRTSRDRENCSHRVFQKRTSQNRTAKAASACSSVAHRHQLWHKHPT